MTKEEKEFLLDLEIKLLARIVRDSDRHYENSLFRPRFSGDTSFDLYIDTYGKEDYEDWKKLAAFNMKHCYA